MSNKNSVLEKFTSLFFDFKTYTIINSLGIFVHKETGEIPLNFPFKW